MPPARGSAITRKSSTVASCRPFCKQWQNHAMRSPYYAVKKFVLYVTARFNLSTNFDKNYDKRNRKNTS